MRQAVQAGDFRWETFPLDGEKRIDAYIGNGRCGARFDSWGLMNREHFVPDRGRTTIMHADHWHRGAYGQDVWLPVARLAWATDERPGLPQAYEQHLALWEGQLRTQIQEDQRVMTITTNFHPERRDLMICEIRYEGGAGMPPIALLPETEVFTQYEQHLQGAIYDAQLDAAGQLWRCCLRIGTADSVIAMKVLTSEGRLSIRDDKRGAGLSFHGIRGRHLLLIGTAAYARQEELLQELASLVDAKELVAELEEAWKRRWGDAYISVPDRHAQAMWARSVFYVLASYAPDVRCPAAPMGWSGNGWPFSFPQDLSYIHPALLRLGYLDIARSWVEFYHSRLGEMKELARDVFQADGAMWAWEFPIGKDSNYLREGIPHWYGFQLHNSAYPARMAWETSRYLDDPEWSREVAWPIVWESAALFHSILQLDDNGTWGIHHQPAMGQDELGGENARNYLCALFSAQYSLATGVKMAEELGFADDAIVNWRKVLRDGLSYSRLLDEGSGLYTVFEGVEAKERLGKQKHPVQLNPLIFLPLGEPDSPTRTAYEARYELCIGANEGFFYGWTLAAYLVAAAHSGDPDGLLRGLQELVPSQYADPDWLQLYESSGFEDCAFYVTSHGLFLQAMNDAIMHDYYGDVRIGASCPAQWTDATFRNLRSADGRIWSGRRTADGWILESHKRKFRS